MNTLAEKPTFQNENGKVYKRVYSYYMKSAKADAKWVVIFNDGRRIGCKTLKMAKIWLDSEI
jgi:hypothetical protein